MAPRRKRGLRDDVGAERAAKLAGDGAPSWLALHRPTSSRARLPFTVLDGPVIDCGLPRSTPSIPPRSLLTEEQQQILEDLMRHPFKCDHSHTSMVACDRPISVMRMHMRQHASQRQTLPCPLPVTQQAEPAQSILGTLSGVSNAAVDALLNRTAGRRGRKTASARAVQASMAVEASHDLHTQNRSWRGRIVASQDAGRWS